MTTFRRALGLTLLVLVAGCGAADEPTLSFAEFKASTFREADTGVYILNGDEIATTDDELKVAYDRYLEDARSADEVHPVSQKLAVNTVNGKDDKWSASAALNITYCINQKSFGSHYNDVVNAMNDAAAAWEGVAKVNFVHVSSLDGGKNCTNRNNSVVFDVKLTNTTQYLARSFFPSSSRTSREILISIYSWGNIAPWTLSGVLRHELGHTLGFRHEHTRPEAGTCYENSSWRALTPYDSSSVMHYPQCNGTQTGDLVLTDLDASGAASLYPF